MDGVIVQGDDREMMQVLPDEIIVGEREEDALSEKIPLPKNVWPIVFPLHPRGGKFRNNKELRYALRSLCENFTGEFAIIIAGKEVPDWLVGAHHIKCGGLKRALALSSKHFPNGFFWWYDDLCLLKLQSPKQLKVTTVCKGFGQARSGWSENLHLVREKLISEGLKPRDYSRPHGPYWFDRSMVMEGFRDWPGMKSKFPWESWILSKRNWPTRHGITAQYYGRFRNPPGPDKVLLNYNGKGSSNELFYYLERRFEPCRFERDCDVLMRDRETSQYFRSQNGLQVAFFHIPKTGGQSIATAFGLPFFGHYSVRDPARVNHLKNADFVFSFVRHPLDRAVSLWAWFAQMHLKPKKRLPENLEVNDWAREMTANEFWEKIFREGIELKSNVLRPQSWFLTKPLYKRIPPKIRIYRFEDLEKEFRRLCFDLQIDPIKLPHINKADHKQWPELFSKRVEIRLREKYRRDFEMFDYE